MVRLLSTKYSFRARTVARTAECLHARAINR